MISGREIGLLFHAWQRFSGSSPEPFCHLGERLEDVLFSCCSRLLLSQNISGSAIPCLQAQRVLASEACDRALHDRHARCPLADFGRHIGRELRTRGPAHQAERLAHARVGKQRQTRGILQLHSQDLAQRAIEDGVACRIRELRQNDRALVREFGRAREIRMTCGKRGDGRSVAFPAACGGGYGREFPLQFGDGLPPASPGPLPDTG